MSSVNRDNHLSHLWSKGVAIKEAVYEFTVGNDAKTDLALVKPDALGTAAHVLMLTHCGYLEPRSGQQIVRALRGIVEEAQAGQFSIEAAQEDVHTALEQRLSIELGGIGRSIHLARSRNDQVILALRLYLRDKLLELSAAASKLAWGFFEFARQNETCPMPGYTHMRRAMPSSLGQWAESFAWSVLEELETIQSIYARLDRCPAGAAAGFGPPIPIDREYTATLLGFSEVQFNPIDVQNSRGRHEISVTNWIEGLSGILEKFLWDVALYSTEEFGFFEFPDSMVTGSSIMPQKKNPDVVELARACCRELRGRASMIREIASGLPSNYHRDLQLLKEPVFRTIDRGHELLDILLLLLTDLQPRTDSLRTAMSPELWAAHEASHLAAHGLPFRDAYQRVSTQIQNGEFSTQASSSVPGLCAPDELVKRLNRFDQWQKQLVDKHNGVEQAIWAYAGDSKSEA